MFFLLRMGFWFSLVLLALPFDFGNADDGAPRVNAIQALSAAGEAVGDLAGLCERKPDVCETGRTAFHTVSVRAQETGRIAMKLLDTEETQNAGPAALEAVVLPETVSAIPANLDDLPAQP
ncbi:DUF5330 domain-containing protein [Mesorhizobium sp. RP14(2022)]|uniref:DUF5330 domain-containing protein n=1 Tax=Mesorhizobium liriopis TaxID=2953882 RepID=A0ABT1C311_9HYPH|nr:DUF5330 domain-containing protein [Mesorhizobium liriopis]